MCVEGKRRIRRTQAPIPTHSGHEQKIKMTQHVTFVNHYLYLAEEKFPDDSIGIVVLKEKPNLLEC